MEKGLPDIALVQINTTVGDLEGNAAKILEFARESVRAFVEKRRPDWGDR